MKYVNINGVPEEKKYILTEETINIDGHILYRIQALKDFGDVKKGDLGGWVQSEKNLSHGGTCWIYDDAKVFENAGVYDDAKVLDRAVMYGSARVYDQSIISEDTSISGSAKILRFAEVSRRARVGGAAVISGYAKIQDHAEIFGDVHILDDAVISGYVFIHPNGGRIKSDAQITSQYDILIIENIGSRTGTTIFYKTVRGGIDVTCGCFMGSIKEFKAAVKKTHHNNEHEKQYLKAIKFAKRYLH